MDSISAPPANRLLPALKLPRSFRSGRTRVEVEFGVLLGTARYLSLIHIYMVALHMICYYFMDAE